jgi:RHS repeat-associated protein
VSSEVDYSYLPDSDLLAGYTNNFGFAVEYGFEDYRNNKTSIENTFSTASTNLTVSTFAYTYDELGRRTQRIDSGAVTNEFGYNDRNELTTALMSTNDYGYAYDNIGNRLTASTPLTSSTYTANELNQYTSISNSTLSAPSSLLYDLDGNLTNDSVRAYTWNGEDRLIAVDSLSPTNGSNKLEFSYDAQGRRIGKKVYTRESDSWSLTSDLQFVYDGWNLIAEIDNLQSQIVNRYVWGLDLSQTLQGAGGIGGLLFANIDGTDVFYGSDVNGNVTDMASTNGEVLAHYEYDPYGCMTAQSGLLSEANPFRFSTKYQDNEGGLYYYGYRYYSTAMMGRWINRDPKEEKGGVSLYNYCINNAVNFTDSLGLAPCGETEEERKDREREERRIAREIEAERALAERKLREAIQDAEWAKAEFPDLIGEINAALPSVVAGLTATIDFYKNYSDVIVAGRIDVQDNMQIASELGRDALTGGFEKWVELVGTGGAWDYKNNADLQSRINSTHLDDFGNVHFGMVANAFGFDLTTSLYGAGTYQTWEQGGGDIVEWGVASLVMVGHITGNIDDNYAREITNDRFGWGDNPGDSLNIMQGWDIGVYYGY